jgi:hypothetical protein
MYYVLLTDVIRVPSPSLEASGKYLFGLGITGHLAPMNPMNPSPAANSPDADITTIVQNLAAAAAAGTIGAELAAKWAPIAPWAWTSFDSVTVTDGAHTVAAVPIVAGPSLDAGSSAALQAAIAEHLKFENGSFIVDEPANNYMPFRGRDAAMLTKGISVGTRKFSYEAFLASLSAAPPPLPQSQMNLVRFFTLTSAQLAILSNAANGIAAIPAFTIQATSFAGAALSANTYFPFDAANKIVQWQYDNPFNGFKNGTKIVARTKLRDPREIIDSTNSFVDMSNLWVRRQHSVNPANGTSRDGVSLEEWAQKLPGRLTNLFDLPRRFLDLFRDDAGGFIPVPLKAGANPDPIASRRLVHATLRALYDTLAPGVWGAPAAAGQPAVRSGLARTAALALYSSDGAGAAAIKTAVDSVIAQLSGQDAAIRASFAPKTEAWQQQTNAFCDALAARVGASLGLPARGADLIPALIATVGGPKNPGPATLHNPPDPDTTPASLQILDRLVALATSPDTAADIFADLWSQAVTTIPSLPPQGDIRNIARQVRVPDAQRRQIAAFALASGGIFAPGAATSKDTDLLQANILASIRGYLLGSLTFAPGTAGAAEQAFASAGVRAECLDRGAIPGASTAAPLGAAEAVLKAEIGGWTPEPLTSAQFKSFDYVPAAAPTATAHGISFQLDRIVTGSGSGAQDDFNLRLAGYGFLMRRSLLQLQPGKDPSQRDSWNRTAESWRLLNAVQGAAGPRPVPPATVPEPVANRLHASDGTLVELLAPTPIASAGGVPRVNFQYDNAPPAGAGAASDVTHTKTPEMADGAPNVFHLIQPLIQDSPPPPERQLLPFLAYGLSYDLVAYGMTNQGALPEELRAPATGGNPSFPAVIPAGTIDVETIFNLASSPKFGDIVRSVRCLRTTSVGHLGFHVDTRAKKLAGYDPFQVPKDVALLAAEVVKQPADWQKAEAVDQLQPTDGRKACLLLAGSTSGADQRGFTISSPGCSLEVLDRWIARDQFSASSAQQQVIANLRRAIRKLYATETATRPDPAADDNSRLEDPAVTGLVVTTQLFRRGGKPVSSDPTPVFVAWPSPLDGFLQAGPPPTKLEQIRRPDAKVNIAITTTPLPANQVGVQTVAAQAGAGPGVNLTVNAGDVALITFHAAVLADCFQVDKNSAMARFDPVVLTDVDALDNVAPAKRLSMMAAGSQYMMFDPIEVVVEAGQPDLPDANDLYKACTFEIDAASGQRRIQLDWTRPADSVKWDAVGAIETGDVAWSFTGRPVTRYPFEVADRDAIPSSTDTPATNPLLWEVETFADRATLAPAIKTFSVPLLQAGKTARLPVETLGNRGPAGVKRFDVVVRNRYAPAYQKAGLPGLAF